MARKVIKTATGPKEIRADEVGKWYCMCGLSTNLPYCNGNHAHTLTEEVDKVYEYDKDLNRKEACTSESCNCK